MIKNIISKNMLRKLRKEKEKFVDFLQKCADVWIYVSFSEHLANISRFIFTIFYY